jgi:Transcriptional regulatory protein, C terminal/Protein of unknown function (DUF1153)
MPHPLTGLEPLPHLKWGEGEHKQIILAHDLPKPGKFRWTDSRRKLFVEAVRHGLLTAEEFADKYDIPLEQFALWGGVTPEMCPTPTITPAVVAKDVRAVSIGVLTVDLIAHTTTVEEDKVTLQPRAQELLEYLARNAGRVITRYELCQHFFGAEGAQGPKGFDVYVVKLRKALGAAAHYVETIWGIGYILRDPNTGDVAAG